MMMMNSKSIRQLARNFCIKYAIGNPSYKSLKQVLQSQGYTLIEFEPYENDETTSLILSKLDLNDFICNVNGFTYSDSEYRLVFVRKNLSDEEKTIVLVHEEGHIVCGHMERTSEVSNTVEQEEEANQFSCYVLHPASFDRFLIYSNRNKKFFLLSIMSGILIIIAIFFIFDSKTRASYYGDYYITEHGDCYHERECLIIKERKNIHRLTIEEFNSGNYKPCQVCLPD